MVNSIANDRSDRYELQLYQQIGWSTGSMGTAVMLGGLTGYGLYFMTTYLGIGALLAGQLIAWSKIYDMISDPVIGQLSDRTESSWGRRRPYLLAGTLACPIALVLLFLPLEFESVTATIFYLGVVLILYATAYTLFGVPYLAMSAEMTSNYNERTLIMSQRIFFSTLGVLVTAVMGPYLIKAFGGGQAGYAGMSWVFAFVIFVAMSITFLSTKKTKHLPPTKKHNYTARQQFELIWQNRPFRFYMAAKICSFISQSAIQGTILFFGRYILGRDEMIFATFGIGYVVGSVLTIPIWNVLISKHIGKRNGYMISAVSLGLVSLSWLLVGENEPLIGLYGRFALSGVFASGIMISGSAMLPDLMEYDRRRSGLNREGLYAAAFMIVEKVGNTAGPIIVGTLLGLTGFISTKGGELVDQPDSAVTAIWLGYALVPFLLSFSGAFLMRFYNLDETVLKTAQSEGLNN